MDGVTGYWVLKAPLIVLGLIVTGLIIAVFLLAYLVELANDIRRFRTTPATRDKWRRRAAEVFASGGPTRG